MPKIKSWSPRIYHKNGERHFDINLMYDSEVGFYCNVPAEFAEVIPILSDEVKKELCINRIYKRGSYHDIIVAKTENDFYGTAPKALTALLEAAVVRKQVIILYFEKEGQSNIDNDYNKEHQKTGVKLAIKYCTELSIGDKKDYAEFTMVQRFSQLEEDRINVYPGRKGHVVLDDTPENRIFVEDFYNKLKQLSELLSDIIMQPGRLLEVISSNQKLLN